MKDNNVKIIGGKWKRKNISFNEAKGLRPTLGRVRETLFNWLGQDLNNKKCLDLFAGTGALGFEALSRNAESCTFVENNPSTFQKLIENKENFKADNAIIKKIHADFFIKNNEDVFYGSLWKIDSKLWLYLSIFFKVIPVPLTTALRGSSAT